MDNTLEMATETAWKSEKEWRRTQLRIEALRAATELMNHEPWWRQPTFRGENVTRPKGVVLLAEKIAEWLETGERP
jgi:hypothetical protein